MRMAEMLGIPEPDQNFILALESARDNIKRVLVKNPASFSKSTKDLKAPSDLLAAAKVKFQGNKSASMNRIAIESYIDTFDDAERTKLRRLYESEFQDF